MLTHTKLQLVDNEKPMSNPHQRSRKRAALELFLFFFLVNFPVASSSFCAFVRRSITSINLESRRRKLEKLPIGKSLRRFTFSKKKLLYKIARRENVAFASSHDRSEPLLRSLSARVSHEPGMRSIFHYTVIYVHHVFY